ncbi:MAG: glyoxylate/hydroxypyruvate reductase A [Pseudomonadota bacterium]
MTETRTLSVAVAPDETDDWQDALASAIQGDPSLRLLPADAAREDVDYLIYNIDSGISDFSPYTRLRAIMNTWAGVEAVLKTLTWPDHIPFCRMVEPGMTIGMVEYFLAHTMRYHMDIDRCQSQSAAAHWEKFMPPLAQDRSVGVLGLGQLGQAIAGRMAANGFQVHGWSRGQKAIPGITCHHGSTGLRDCLSVSEILCVILPLTAETENVLNGETLALMPEGAKIINAGRGPLIDDDALLAALASGQIGHATLDVFRSEPLPENHPYWRHPQVTVTPHIAAFTRTSTASAAIVAQIKAHMAGGALQHIVDRARGY